MLNLTRPERIALSILIGTLILGFSVSIYKQSRLPPAIEIKRFDIERDGAAGEGEDLLISREKININEASRDELMELRGVGRTIAQRIIDYRDSYGSFASPDDIKKVKGVGKSLFEKIKDDIVTE